MEALRIADILVGIVILILCYYLGYKLFNSFVGSVSTLLLATNTSFILLEKRGGDFGFSLPIFTLTSLLFLLKWHESRRNLYFYLGMFFLGLGFNTKLYFIWFIFSLFISGLLLYAPRYKLKIKTTFLGIITFLLVALPFLSVCCKILSDFSSRFGGKGLVSQGYVNNLEILKNLSTRIKQLSIILEGSFESGGPSGAMYYDYRFFLVFFFWFCILCLLCLIFIKKTTIVSGRRIILILLITFIMLTVSIFTPVRLLVGHFLIFFPFIQMIMAVGLYEMLKISQSKINTIAVYLLVLVLVAINIIRCGQMYQVLRQEETNKASCNVTMLTQWLLDHKIYRPIVATACLLEFCSNENIQPTYFAWYLVNWYPRIREELKNKIKNASPEDYFVFGLSGDSNAQNAFNDFAREFNKEVIIKKVFFWANGKPRFIVCSVK